MRTRIREYSFERADQLKNEQLVHGLLLCAQAGFYCTKSFFSFKVNVGSDAEYLANTNGGFLKLFSSALHGLILAIGLILPLGVQNVFVFNQGAIQPRLAGVLPVVITAALCDTFLIVAAVLGVSVIVLGSYWIKTLLLGAGVLFLLYMGWVTWKSKPGKPEQSAERFTPRKQIAFAASVSLLNPHAIMDTIGVIGTSSLRYTGMEKAAFLVACVFVSWVWFSGLAVAGRITGSMDKTGRFMSALNKCSAVIMWGTAVYLAFTIWEGN